MAAALMQPGVPVDFSRSINHELLNGCTAIVTGGASGIGLAIATAIAKSGGNVTIADYNGETGKAAAEELNKTGYAVQYVKTNVASWEDQVNAFKRAAETSSKKTVDIVVTSAGIGSKLASLPHPTESDEPRKPPTDTLDVNLYGTYYSTVLALWYFTRAPPSPVKQLLFIASMKAYAEPPPQNLTLDYMSSKFGVRAIWQQLFKISDRYGNARFNLIAPTFVDTPLLQPGEVEAQTRAGLKVATRADVVDAALRCLCDAEVQGRAVGVSGGEAIGGKPGDANFDLLDTIPDHLGGKALLEALMKGWFMDLPQ